MKIDQNHDQRTTDGLSIHHEHHQLLWRPYEMFIAMLGIGVVVALTCVGLVRA